MNAAAIKSHATGDERFSGMRPDLRSALSGFVCLSSLKSHKGE